MWRPLSKALELLGRIRLRPPFRLRTTLRVGDPGAPDAMGSTGWRDYLDAERLHDVWGPHPESAWTPFHCVPLFAALDSLRRDAIGPTRLPEPGDQTLVLDDPTRAQTMPADATSPPVPADTSGAPPSAPLVEAAPGLRELPPYARPGAPPPAWLQRDTWTIVDLPGPLAVEAAAWLVTTAGCQPVCTFDNWPHARGVLRAEHVLAELLKWATTIADARRALDASAPPVWICDADRLGAKSPTPGEFDNRYYLDDSILPGVELLRSGGIRKVVYLAATSDPPLLDLDGYFRELGAAGMPVLQASVSGWLETLAINLPAVPRQTPTHFNRSGAGGFGQDVPQPSSGSSGG